MWTMEWSEVLKCNQLCNARSFLPLLMHRVCGICNTTLFTKLLTTASIHGGMSFFCNSTTFWRTGLFWTSFSSSFYGSFLCSDTSTFSFLMQMLNPNSNHGHKQKFKYPYPRDSKIIQMPLLPGQNVRSNPSPMPCLSPPLPAWHW